MFQKLISHCQGLLALVAAVLIFWLSPHLLHWLDPTAGTFDAGYLQRPLVAAVYFFFGIFLAWLAFQLDFPSLDQWLDKGGFAAAWRDLPSAFKPFFTLAVLTLLLGAYLVCLWLVPV